MPISPTNQLTTPFVHPRSISDNEKAKRIAATTLLFTSGVTACSSAWSLFMKDQAPATKRVFWISISIFMLALSYIMIKCATESRSIR